MSDLFDSSEQENQDVAIIGIALRFPGASDPESFWQNLRSGVESLSHFSDAELRAAGIAPASFAQPGYVRSGFVVEHIDLFDAEFFGFSRRQAELTDPQQRLFLECAWEALERAGIDPARAPGPIGIYAGSSLSSYLLRYYATMQKLDGSANKLQMLIGNDKDYLASQAAYRLGLTGPCVSVQTACSTGLVATHLACQSLLGRECDVALAGAVTLRVPQKTGYLYEEGALFSPDGHCRAFDAQAHGTVAGNGVAMIVMKRLRDALAQRDNILAVIKGSAINNDGSLKIGYTAPSEDGQANVIAEALGVADVDPESITYIETHGTGTPLGDPIEIAALKRAFGNSQGKRNHCAIGSLKTNIGHLENAAGLAGLIKTVLALCHRELPPSLHFSSANPQLGLADSPFYVNHRLTKWLPPQGAVGARRRAGVSSFGIGGTNAHVIVEEAPPPLPSRPAPGTAARPLHLLPISAKSSEALTELASRYVDFLPGAPDEWADICFTVGVGRTHFSHRAAIVAADKKQAVAQLQALRDEAATEPRALPSSTGKRRPRIAFLFTGQGSQYLGMGRELYETHSLFRQTIDACDQLLRRYMGRSLTALLYPREPSVERALLDSHTCGLTANFAIECALVTLWRSWGIEPDLVLGHSLGDFAAAYAAGVLSLEEGLQLVTERGRLMELAHGAMVSAIASAQDVSPLAARYPDVSVAVVNAPKSIVLSGTTTSITQLALELTQAGFKNQILTIPVPAHSSLLDPVLHRFETAVRRVTLRTPTVAVISSMTGGLVTSALTHPSYWRDHLRNPVRFADGVTTLSQQGIDFCIEIGPKPTLLGIVGQCVEGSVLPSPVLLPSLRDKRPDWQQLLESVAELYVHGVDLNWSALYGDVSRRKVVVPTYPFQRTRYWIDAEPAQDMVSPPSSLPQDAIDARSDSSATAATGGDLYELIWRPSAGLGSGKMAAPWDVAETLRAGPLLAAFAQDARSRRYQAEMAALDALSLTYMRRALEQLGALTSVPSQDLSVLGSRLGVVPAYQRLFVHWLHTVSAQTQAIEPAGLSPSPRANDSLVQYEAQLLLRCGERLAEVVTGRCDPLTLLFPDGDASGAAPLYSVSPESQLVNALAQQAVAMVLAALPLGRRLRVLEVGAGSGGTTAGILPLLHGHPVDYVFTDISPFFINKAKARFHDFPFVQYQSLDIEKPISPQLHGSFDIVLAANVLHATRDLAQTLANVRAMLAPDGMLVLIEGTSARPWLDVTYGLTTGWWRFADAGLRPDYPLLDPEAWRAVLERNGFVQPTLLVPDGGTQAVMLARSSATSSPRLAVAASPPERWLILGDGSGVGQQLAAGLRARGHDCRLLGSEDGLDAVVAEAESAPLSGVVDLVELDGGSPETMSSAAMESETLRHCQRSLALVQRLLGLRDSTPALWMVTRGAVAVAAEDALGGLALAPLWGLGKVIALEHKEIWGGLIDLPASPEADEAERLLSVLTARSAEDQVAVRSGKVFVPRLVRYQATTTQSMRFRPDRTYLLTGGFGFLGRAFAERMVASGAARHLVLVGRHVAGHEATVHKLQAAGAQVLAVSADVASATEMARCLETVRTTMPPLAGIVHAAGITIYQTLQAMQPHELAAMLRPKLVGAWVLHELTKQLPLDFFVSFSSAGSVWGAKGQGHYAAANQFLDGFASYRRHLGLPAVTINWGTVAGERMATDEYFQWLTKIGMGDLGLDRAFSAFQQVLTCQGPQLIAANMDWSRFREIYEVRGPRPLLQELPRQPASAAATPLTRAPATLLPVLAATPAGERLGVVTTLLQQEVGQVLGETRRLDIRLGFSDLGLDSLMMVELVGRLKAKLGLSLPTTLAFDYANIENLAVYLLQRILGEQEMPLSAPSAKIDLALGMDQMETAETDQSDDIETLIQQELAEIQRLLK